MGCNNTSNRDDSLVSDKKSKDNKKTTNNDDDDSQNSSDSEEKKKGKDVLKLDKKNGKKGKDDKKSDKKDDKKSNKKNDKKDDKKSDKKNDKKDDKKKGKKDDKEDEKEDNKKNDKKKDSKPKKMDMKKSSVNGVTLMKGIENFLPEDINEDQVYELIEASLKESIQEEKKGKREPGTITPKQAKVISSIIYDRIKKGKTEDINIKKYPELKGLDIKIGIQKLTKDVVKDYIFDDEKVDDKKINSEYKELTKNNDDVNALTIQILS